LLPKSAYYGVDGGPKQRRGSIVAAVEFCSAQMCIFAKR
jgi:hypothetical protein